MTSGKLRRIGVGETAAGAVLGLTVFCMVLGSSSVTEVIGPGKKLRWVSLVTLALVGIVLSARDARRLSIGSALRRVFAATAWFAAIALISTAWSVDPRLTFERAGSLALVFVAAGALALSARVRPLLSVRLLQGVLAGAVAAAAAGLVVLAFRHGAAVQPATTIDPARLRGLGQNPDTVAMLCALGFPIALWMLLRTRRRAEAGVSVLALALLVGTIAASGSRGGIIAAVGGGLVLSLANPAPVRRRLLLASAVLVSLSGATAITRIPQPLSNTPANYEAITGSKTTKPSATPAPGTEVGGSEKQYAGRLADELYRFAPARRSLLQSSGRLEAWRGGIGQADARPILGYGFGTEERVFISRFYNFNGVYVENSFIGVYLQLGALGLASFVALLVTLALAALKAVRRANVATAAPALAALFASGVVLMLVQSYAYSVGNIVTVAFWVCSVGVGALATQPERPLAEAANFPRGQAVAPA